MARKPKSEPMSSNVDPDLMVEALGWYAEKRGDIASIQQEIATGLGRYEKQGIDKKALKLAYSLQSSDMTPEEIAAQRRREHDYLRWAGIITVEADGQTSIITGLEPKKPSTKAARKLELGRVQADAYNSQRAGGTLDDNPHTAGTEEYAVWAESFTRARADAVEEAEKAALPPAKRGRKTSPAAAAVEALQAPAERLGGDMPADPT
jgi:hypothetical protein